MVIVDTCVLIDHIRLSKKSSSIVSAFDQLLEVVARSNIAISILTVQELFSGKSSQSYKEFKRIENLIKQLTILTYDMRTALLAGQIERDSKSSIGFVDAALAATTIDNYYELYTLNTSHFQHVPNLHLFKI